MRGFELMKVAGCIFSQPVVSARSVPITTAPLGLLLQTLISCPHKDQRPPHPAMPQMVSCNSLQMVFMCMWARPCHISDSCHALLATVRAPPWQCSRVISPTLSSFTCLELTKWLARHRLHNLLPTLRLYKCELHIRLLT